MKKDGLLEADPDELERLLEEAGIDEETAFQVFYHHTMSLDEIADELREHLEPSQVELAIAMFDYAVSRAPSTSSQFRLPKELFHGALSNSLTVLMADRNPHAVKTAATLILQFPDETETICTYLRAVAQTAPEDVCNQIRIAMCGEFLLGWQIAWLLNALLEVVDGSGSTHLPEQLRQQVMHIFTNEAFDWLARAAAARVLGNLNLLDRSDFTRIWSIAPGPLRPEFADAVCTQSTLSEDNDWTTAFVDSIAIDTLLRSVIIRRRESLTAKNHAAPAAIEDSHTEPESAAT